MDPDSAYQIRKEKELNDQLNSNPVSVGPARKDASVERMEARVKWLESFVYKVADEVEMSADFEEFFERLRKMTKVI